MNNEPTYLFYDIETTGLNKSFDQVLQFAAIRTDLSLNEINRIEINAKLNIDVVPSPAAVITHRIGPSQFTQGESELEAVKKIHQLLNTPKTISVGYNTLGFDDEFLRFSFYRNLLSPYTHQYANGCARMDIYPITMMYYLFKPQLLEWPRNEKGISLKLENINASNALASGQAHDAMVDVEVTLALAKRLIKDPSTWQYLTAYFKKTTDEQRIINCESTFQIGNHFHKIGLMAYGKIGAKAGFIAPVIHCGQHLHYKNQTLWLRLDADNIKDTPFVLKKKMAEPPLFLPLKERFLLLLSEERRVLMQENLNWLSKNPTFFSDLCKHHQHEKYPIIPGVDIDAALYQIGFPSQQDDKQCRDFHNASPNEKSAMANRFQDPGKQEQAIRVLGRHYPQMLSDTQRLQFQSYQDAGLIDFRGEKKLTYAQALSDITALRSNDGLDLAQQKLLVDLENYLLEQQKSR